MVALKGSLHTFISDIQNTESNHVKVITFILVNKKHRQSTESREEC